MAAGADVLVIERQPPAGQPPRVETFSFKSRDLKSLNGRALEAQIGADASDALAYYGETLSIRRPGMEMEAQVQRVRLIYEGGNLTPPVARTLTDVVNRVGKDVKGVEVLVQ